MLEHGGALREAAQRYGIPLENWLDLSTGINPLPWQGAPPAWAAWTRLPEADDGLAEAAQACYGAPHALPVAGSQAAIQALPLLREPCRVGILTPAYAEHAHAWRRAGHHVTPLAADQLDAAADFDVLVLGNPNNPTGQTFAPATLLGWHDRLARRGGWLVVDEAFSDATPEASLAAVSNRPGLIVLRSLGKFFGLAGARVGFVLAEAALLHRLAEPLGPWCIAGPARAIAKQALSDRDWQVATRARLRDDSTRLADLLTRHGLPPGGACALFQWVETPAAQHRHAALAQTGILTRLFAQPASLRFGLPETPAQWQRLEFALSNLDNATLRRLG
ncbi:MAG: threonine-phosphate decarboxylase [Sulfuricella sp.]|nr:threonine-phosphate decarboxylase [Sulfuricella sp.]